MDEILPAVEWRDIKDYEGRYQVSNYGKVRGFMRVKHRQDESHMISAHVNRHGYVQSQLWYGGKMKLCYVHRLVAGAFLGTSDLEVNHLDGDKCNNVLSNLEYCTPQQNMIHSRRVLGIGSGERNGRAKLTAVQVVEIRELLRQGLCQGTIAKQFDVTSNLISQINVGRIWRDFEPKK
jgi:hypothetical protein